MGIQPVELNNSLRIADVSIEPGIDALVSQFHKTRSNQMSSY